MGISLVWIATWDPNDIQGLYKVDLTPHWLQHLGELALILTDCNTQEHGPNTLPRIWWWGGASPEGMRAKELATSFICQAVSDVGD